MADVVGNARRGDPDGQEQTEGVDADVTLAACDFLACDDEGVLRPADTATSFM
jgi:hypothetical protein